jgi:hypothetical protein
MFVGPHQRFVRPDTVDPPNVEQIVGTSGIVNEELFRQGFSRSAVTTTRVGREKQDFKWTAVLKTNM